MSVLSSCRGDASLTAVLLCLFPSDYTVEEQPSETLLIQELESGRAKPLVFVLNANLLAMVKLVNCMFLFYFQDKMHENSHTSNTQYTLPIKYRAALILQINACSSEDEENELI